MRGSRAAKWSVAAAAVLLADSAADAGRFEVLGMGGAGGMFTPASAPFNPKLMFVSCDMSGAYRSTDGGRTWEMIDSMQMRSCRGARPMFAGPAVYWAHGGRELRVSTDAGQTWKPVVRGQPPWGTEGITRLGVPGSAGPVLLVGTGAGVFASGDGGKTWRTGPAGAVTGLTTSGLTVFAATGEKLWAGEDCGKSWREVTSPLADGEVIALAGGAAAGRQGLYAVVAGEGVFGSSDGGRTWKKLLAPGGEVGAGLFDVVMAANQTAVAYACNGRQVFRTADAGATWKSVFRMDGRDANVEKSWVQTQIRWGYRIMSRGLGVNAAEPNIVMVSTQGDLYKSVNGGRSWHQLMNHPVGIQPGDPGYRYRSNGLEVTSVWEFLFDPFDENRCYIAYTDIGFARSVDRGRTWIYSARGSHPWSNTFYGVVFDPHVKGRMYAAASNRHDIPHWTHISSNKPHHSGGVVVSDDHGVRWRHASAGLPKRPCTSICLDPRSPRGERTLYATLFGAGVYKSTDGARAWAKKSKGLGNPGNLHALQVEVHPRTGEVFCSITAHRHGRAFRVPGGLWKSADAAESWTDLTKPLKLGWATGFALHPADPETVYLCAATWPGGPQGGVYKTTDGGKTWKRILADADFAKRRPPGYVHVMNAVLHPDDPDIVYVCSTHGLWVSRDAGETWKWFTDIPFGSAQNVAFDPKDTRTIYVTTFGGGTWRGPHLP